MAVAQTPTQEETLTVDLADDGSETHLITIETNNRNRIEKSNPAVLLRFTRTTNTSLKIFWKSIYSLCTN